MRAYPTKILKVSFKTLLQPLCYGCTITNNHKMAVLLFCLAWSCFFVGVYCKKNFILIKRNYSVCDAAAD